MKELMESLNISGFPYVNALVIIAAAAVVAKIADLVVDKVFRRFTRFTKTDLDDRIIDAVHRPIFYTILLAGLVNAIIYLEPPEKALFYLSGALYSAVAFIWTFALVKVSNAVVEHGIYKASDVTGLSKDVVPLVENVMKIAIFVAGFMAVLSIWRISITPLLASAGIAGVGVAIAAKDTLSNLFGGISVFMDKPFKIGDYVVLDQGERGEVVAIGLRSTRIKTRDDIMITVPNSIIANTKIINESAPIPNFRVRIPFSVAYGSDVDVVEEVVLGVAAENSNVLSEPEPRARFRSFGESSLDFELLCWAKEPALRGLTIHELNKAVYKAFAHKGIKIPFPQRDVHMKKDGDGP